MNVFEYSHHILRLFQSKYPDYYRMMNEMSHDSKILSDWHAEGNLWAHTMAVFSQMVAKMDNVLMGADVCIKHKSLLIAALLHDVGKVDAFFEGDDGKYRFNGHEGMSTFAALDILMWDLDGFLIDQSDVAYILRLINNHDVLFNLENEDWSEKSARKIAKKVYSAGKDDTLFLRDLIRLRNCDMYGSIANKTRHLSNEAVACLCRNINDLGDVEKSYHMNKKAIVMIGLPCSGKTTWALSNLNTDYKMISRDNLVLSMSGSTCYTEAFQIVDHVAVDKEYDKILKKCLENGDNIVIDKTNLTYKGRFALIERLRKYKYHIEYVLMLPTSDKLGKMADDRVMKVIPHDVVENMKKSFDFPSYFEYDALTINYVR